MKRRQEGGRSRHAKREACASCGARATNVIVIGELLAGMTLPPFHVCRHCDDVYRSSPTKEAAERFVLEMVQERLRRLRERY